MFPGRPVLLTHKLFPAPSQGTWAEARSWRPVFIPQQADKPQREHKALNISAVGMWRLCQNPKFLIAGFESHICLNNTIKLCFKPAF